MTDARPGVFPAAWHNLPDPTAPRAPQGGQTVVLVHLKQWKHIVEKHVANRGEPWEEVLSEEARGAALNGSVLTDEASPLVLDSLYRLQRQVTESLRRPLVLLYRSKRPGKTRRRVWLMLLPCGATAYALQKGKKASLVTCYFPRAAVVERRRDRRWSRVLTGLVFRYAKLSQDGRCLLTPDPEHKVTIDSEETQETRTRIRFVTPETWGFLAERSSCPWRGRLSEWEAAGPPPQRLERKRRLRPWTKRRRDEDLGAAL